MSRLVVVRNLFGVKAVFKDMFKSSITVGSMELAHGFEFKKGDVLALCGGADISPSLYKQNPSRYTSAGKELSPRDAEEFAYLDLAVRSEVPIVGICRGAQLLCAYAGGTLFQHVTHHAGGNHEMLTLDGEVMEVSSAHHQMMNPFGTKHTLLAWSKEKLSDVYLGEKEALLEVELEPEVVFFEDIKGLGIQYHPEFMSRNDRAVEYSRQLISKYLIGV